ncbi:hypothetical protein TRICI_001030 [Trichomonascus ciferrii]|uniref:Uncharacterized protein n=1 Tax=Trichomonascus ciferrii TaxID=44093 RepID=A0A642VAQ5_9ASCO|nr:hypothetical protein TRICI_001030 [Trichomonascus ciferrii]
MSSASVEISSEDCANDPVLAVLYNPELSYDDIEVLCDGHGFGAIETNDILTAYRILTRLTMYLSETESWSFGVLAAYDFQSPARAFDLDIAVVVGTRSELLLREITSWGLQGLKDKVNQLDILYSDSATVLTTLVLRIISIYSDLEFKLQLALSRSTLVKIHSELEGLLSNFHTENAEDDPPLVKKYRSFVTQLITELETTPFESVQQEMFQIVRDLHGMFVKFSQNSSSAHHVMDKYLSMDDDAIPPMSPTDMTSSSLESSWGALPGSPSPHSRTSVHTANTSPLSSSFIQDYKGNDNHRRTFSSSSTAFSTTSKSSVTDELPSMLHAFEVAKREERTRAPLPRKSSRSSMASEPSSSAFFNKHRIPPSLSFNTNSTQPKLLTGQQQSSSSSSSSDDTLQVKMVDNRMMVKVGASFMDMQEWLNRQNNTQPTSTMAMLKNSWQNKPNTTNTTTAPAEFKKPRKPLPPKWTNNKTLTDLENQFEKNYVTTMDNF